MSWQVWKFPIEAVDHPRVKMPRRARLLDFKTQGGEPFVWAIVNPAATEVVRMFRLAGTGHTIEERTAWADDVYVGTVHLPFSGLVFRLFDLGEDT